MRTEDDAKAMEYTGDNDPVIEWARELQSLAQAGLWYVKDDFDRERFQRIREISAEMMAERTGIPKEKVTVFFCNNTGYQTPKVDTRAAIIKDGRILLVRERDGKWAMPGGWCDYNMSAAENTIKEAKEEAGLDIAIEKVISVQDRDRHNHPPYVYKVIKIFYLCRPLGGEFVKNIETSESRYFSENELPELAEEKTTEEQIRMCLDASRSKEWQTHFDGMVYAGLGYA